MSQSGFQLALLRDERLAPIATSALPAWLWSVDASRILWANPTGAAIFGAASSAAIRTRKFDTGQPAAAQIAQLATTLPPDGSQRIERLRGFGAGVGRALPCMCARIALTDDAPAILVVATERAGPELALDERARRLLAGCDQPVAAFAPDGELIHATPAATPRLAGATSLAALGVAALAAGAAHSDRPTGTTIHGPIAVDHIGSEAETVLIATFALPVEADEAARGDMPVTPDPAAVETAAHSPPQPSAIAPDAAPPSELAQAPTVAGEHIALEPPASAPASPASPSLPEAPPTPSERRHPLRFVWQMDEEGRFTLGSDEFVRLIGPQTAAVLGRSWQEIASKLGLDPESRVAQALATHDTWSGLTVGWPVDDSAERLAVELSGLPVFDRARAFRGYRGFGVCRDLERLAELAHRRNAAANPSAAPASIDDSSPKPSAAEPQAAVDAPVEAAAAAPVEAAAVAPVENVVPFPTAEPNAPALSPIERSAFRELSRRLTQRLNHGAAEPDAATAASDADDAACAATSHGDPPTFDPPALAAAAAVHLPAPAPPIDRDALATHEAEQIALRDATDARPFLDRLPFGVLVYRLSHLIYCNRAFLRWSGYESIEALAEAGGLDSLFVEPEGVSFEKGGEKPFAISSSRGEETEAEGRLFLVPWDGESAFALLTTPVAQAREPNGNPALELAQAEIAELNSILDTATDGVVLIDRAGLVLSSNRSAEALFGYESRELAGRSFFDLLAPESMDVASEYLDGLRQEGAARLLNSGRDVIGRVRQGGLIPLFMTMGRIGDRPDKLCAVFRDITSWKKAEEELTDAKRQAEKASSAKSDFLAKISHEIRTPLNSIIGFSEVMMEERFGPVGNERYRAYLRDIHASGGHLISLINDLLDLSKIEAGKLELTFAGVSLNDLTQQCVAIMQPQANRERIILRSSLAPKLPQIVADARSVRQIVLNLLSNSIKFTGAGGQVIVSTALTDAHEVVLRVRDTGIGMSEKDIETALEPFRQLATSARAGGTGLGLPLTKALAEANRASFHIRSAPNAGTLVEIAFPATQVLAG
ncbi:MAG: PAS domain S-box protein [Xanthobacteraceae bacterium]|jgi:PAS domain S-box-containing protein